MNPGWPAGPEVSPVAPWNIISYIEEVLEGFKRFTDHVIGGI